MMTTPVPTLRSKVSGPFLGLPLGLALFFWPTTRTTAGLIAA